MKNKFIKLSAFVFATVALASCLKDKNFDNGSAGIENDQAQQKVVSIELTTTDTLNFLNTSFAAAATTSTFNLVPIQIAGGAAATTDVHVVVALDPTLVTAYNLANGTAYTTPASSTYTIPSLTVTIPAGQSRGYVQISLIPNNFIGLSSAFGLRIVSVDGGYLVAAGYKSYGVAAFGIKNEFQGSYSNAGVRYAYPVPFVSYTYPNPVPAGYSAIVPMPSPKFAATIDATHNAIDMANQGGAGHQYYVNTPAGASTSTSTTPIPVTIVLSPNALAQYSNISYQHYDYTPATHTYHFITSYNNAPGGSGVYRILDETLTLQP